MVFMKDLYYQWRKLENIISEPTDNPVKLLVFYEGYT